MRKTYLLAGMVAVLSWAGSSDAAEFVLQPVSATGGNPQITGTEIRLTGGGHRVILELKVKGFAPNALKTYQATFDCGGFASGTGGDLTHTNLSCPSTGAAGNTFCQNAFGESGTGSSRCLDLDPGPGTNLRCEHAWTNRTRTDFVFTGIFEQVAVDLSSCNHRWGATTGADVAVDDGSTYYAGAMAVDVPADAIGTYILGFVPGQGITFQANENGNELNPLFLTQARITVTCVNAAQCNDNNSCTNDTCNAQGNCVNTPNYNTSTQCCDPADGGLCTISDGNQCTADACNTSTGECTHTNSPSGATCGNQANSQCDLADTCNGAGQCQSNIQPNGTSCGSTNHTECDFADTCNGAGTCLANIQPVNTVCGSQATGPCDGPDRCNGAGACLANTLPNNTPCDDSQFCTDNTRCTNGTCGSGTPHSCADSLTCTTDACDENIDDCVSTLDPGRCLIDGACYVDGDLEPGNTCAECDPGASTSDWTTLGNGTLCNDGNACTGTGREGIGFDTCTEGTCEGVLDPQCNDQCEFSVPAIVGANLSTNSSAGDDGGTASCQVDTHADVWFEYTADCDGFVFISTTGSNLLPVNDPVLNVFNECVIDGGSEIAGACDDDSGADLNAALIFQTQQGEDYFIRVSGFGSNKGDIVLNLSPAGDCLIDGVCYSAYPQPNSLNPENGCQACVPQISTTEWSNIPEGTDCGDPSDTECDSPDACDGAGVCELNWKTDGITCSDDGIECTKNLCNSGMCTHPPEPLGLACGAPDDTECDNPDTCNGGGICTPNFEGPGFACGDQSNTQCDKPDACNGAGFCNPRHSPNGILCNDGDICTSSDACQTGLCVGTATATAPVVEAISTRHIRVTPQPAADDTAPVSLRVTSPTWPCLLQYVSETGTLVPPAQRVFKTASEWGTILLQDPDIVPSSLYEVVAECGTFQSPVGSDSTPQWGDINQDGVTDFADISLVVDAFRNVFVLPLQAYDVFGCTPSGHIDFSDISWIVDAFRGLPYPCSSPCHP